MLSLVSMARIVPLLSLVFFRGKSIMLPASVESRVIRCTLQMACEIKAAGQCAPY